MRYTNEDKLTEPERYSENLSSKDIHVRNVLSKPAYTLISITATNAIARASTINVQAAATLFFVVEYISATTSNAITAQTIIPDVTEDTTEVVRS